MGKPRWNQDMTPSSPPPRDCAPSRSARWIWPALWRWLCRLAFGLQVLAGCLAAQASTPAALVVGADLEPYGVRWVTLAYGEAFRRMGIAIHVASIPLARRTMLADKGEIDVDSGRIYQYGAEHPNLIRVEEPFAHLTFALFGINPTLRFARIEELKSSDLAVEYRRGILFCENQLNTRVAPTRLSEASSEAHGLRKPLAGRTDLYCDLEYPVRALLNSPEYRDMIRVYKALELGSVPIYPYLHRKHATLAPQLAATLRQMKAEGLIESYRLQVEAELGWTR